MRRRQVTVPEYEFLIGDGSLAGALAGRKMRFVYDEVCRDGVRADEWREHLRETVHEAWAFEVAPDYVTDCVVLLDGPAVWPLEAMG